MVEFGEQLRRAREKKGMTQQSLAEKLYVTRQAVSRWECGDRYPDLLTTKKISQVLEVSLDDLLSGKEMVKVVERNPVIENKSINNFMIALYAFVVISYLITAVDIFMRFPLRSEAIDASDIQLIVAQGLGIVMQIAVFSYGLFLAIKGTLSPKRMGVVIATYFGAMCITSSSMIAKYDARQLLLSFIFTSITCLLGAVASVLFYICGSKNRAYIYIIYAVAVWEIVKQLYTSYLMIVGFGLTISTNVAVKSVLNIAIYGLIIYQTYTLDKKRKSAIDMEAE